MEYVVHTRETVSRTFVVDLDTYDAGEAKDIAAEQINSGSLVLPTAEVTEKAICVECEYEGTGWSEY